MDIKQLGPYRLGRVLGYGGMGTVYLGTHEQTQQQVAIKVLTPNFARDDTFRERFQAEVESLEKLRHPNIVELLGFGEHHGYLFYAMEYVKGTTLQQELAAGRRFHWREVVRFGIEICSALKHAHDHGVIHRDIKPANLLITEDEHIKLTDFGIAKLFGNQQMTVDGGVLGTADYMSPEQAEGAKVTLRCDLYSVGAVIYALLSGAPPFSGKSIPEVVHKVRFEHPIPIGRLVADVPRELELLLEQLLSKDPARRVPTALAVANRLQAIQHALSIDRTKEEIAQLETGTHETGTRPTSGPETEVAVWTEDDDDQEHRAPGVASTSGDLTPATPRVQRTVNSQETAVPESSGRSGELAHATPLASSAQSSSFVTVDEEYRMKRRKVDPEPAADEGWFKWVGVVGFALILAGLVWLIIKPATADGLYDRISQAMDTHGPAGVLQVEAELLDFQQRFPDDPRAAEINALVESLELAHLDRRLRRRARYDGGDDTHSPLEISLIRILYLERSDPQMAVVHLRALLDVYGQAEQLSQEDQECLVLARQWLRRLESQLGGVNEALRRMIRERMVHAAQVQGEDPKTARAIYRGIVELYGEQSWARDLVAEARRNLRQARRSTP